MSDSSTPDTVANSISKFVNNPDDGTIVPAYFRKQEMISNKIWNIKINRDKNFNIRKVYGVIKFVVNVSENNAKFKI